VARNAGEGLPEVQNPRICGAEHRGPRIAARTHVAGARGALPSASLARRVRRRAPPEAPPRIVPPTRLNASSSNTRRRSADRVALLFRNKDERTNALTVRHKDHD
jgi:hypothetical protein